MANPLQPVVRAGSSEVTEAQPIDPLLVRLATIRALSADQALIVTAMQGPPQRLRPRSQLGHEGAPAAAAYVIREGWVFAYALLANGERQVIDFLLPGDIVGLDDLFRVNAEMGFETITDTVVREIPMAAVRRASRQWPQLFEFFLRLQSESHSALVAHLIDVARRDSYARVAHLLLALERRLMPVGSAGPDGYACPISQYLIADALGLTAIHVNRVLRALREEEVVTVRNERVSIHDRARLMEIAGCNGGDSEDSAVIVLANGRGRQTPVPGGNRSRVSC